MFSLTKLNPEIIPEEDNKQTKSKHNDTKSSSIQKYKVSEDICVAICRFHYKSKVFGKVV